MGMWGEEGVNRPGELQLAIKNNVMDSPQWPLAPVAGGQEEKRSKQGKKNPTVQAICNQPRKITAIKAMLEGASYQVENKKVQLTPQSPDLGDSGWKVHPLVGH